MFKLIKHKKIAGRSNCVLEKKIMHRYCVFYTNGIVKKQNAIEIENVVSNYSISNILNNYITQKPKIENKRVMCVTKEGVYVIKKLQRKTEQQSCVI